MQQNGSKGDMHAAETVALTLGLCKRTSDLVESEAGEVVPERVHVVFCNPLTVGGALIQVKHKKGLNVS